MAKNEFFNSIKDDFTSIAFDGEMAGQFTGYIDTGCYIFNALLSGSLFGGLPNNKITAIAGESSTGKTFLALGIVRNFLDKDDTAKVVYYDTEGAITKEMLEERGIDTKRVIISEPDTIQRFRTHAIKVLDKYIDEKGSFPLLMVLDSLGMLSTSKEMEDSTEGKDTRDMTKAQVIKATFRVITLKAAKAKVPIIVTNHTYQSMGMFPTKELSGGCLAAGTRVLIDTGFKNIEDFVGGERVFSKEEGLFEVIQTHVFEKEVYEIVFEDGYSVKCSPEHKFLVNGNWVEAQNLTKLDEVDVV